MLRHKIYKIVEIADQKNKSGVVFDFIIYFSIVLNIILYGIFTFYSNERNASFVLSYNVIYSCSIIIYTIELLIRIWTSIENEKYKNPLWGRIKFLSHPLIVIDTIVVLTFFLFGSQLNIIFLRSIRLFNVSEYIGGSSEYSPYRLMKNSFSNKKIELLITFFGSLITLIICSYLIYFIEKTAQPDALNNITPSLKWAFGVLTNSDTIDFSPITNAGKIINIFMTILGVLIIGLPLGIITSGFISEIEDEKKRSNFRKNAEIICKAFVRENKITVRNEVNKLNLSHDSRFKDLDFLSARLQFSQNELFETIRNSTKLRIRACKKHRNDIYEENLIVEHFPANTLFGTFINNGTKLHIISTQNYSDPGIGHFSRMIAKTLNANYYSNEYFSSAALLEENRINFANNSEYLNKDDKSKNIFNEWKSCLYKNIKPSDLVIYFGTAGSHNEGDFYLLCGGEKGVNDFSLIEQPTHSNIESVANFYEKCKISLSKIDLKLLANQQFSNTDSNQCSRAVHSVTKSNVISIYVNVNFLQFTEGEKYYQSIRIISDTIKSIDKDS